MGEPSLKPPVGQKAKPFTEHERTRLAIVISIWAIIAVALPMWWKTTEVHRAPLPFAQMQQASSSIFNTSFHVNLDLAIRDTVTVDHKAFAASVDEKLHRIFALQAESGGTHFVFHVNARSIEKDSYAGDSIAKNGNYIVGIACDLTNLEGQSPITGKVHADRLLEIQFHSDCSSEHITDEVALTIGGLFREEQKEFSTSSLQKTDTLENMREVQFSPEYKIALSLLNADPNSLTLTWDAREALDVYLKPFLQSVSSLSHFEVVSQIQQFAALPLEPQRRLDSNRQYEYILRPNALPLFINSAEWNLASDLTASPSLNLVVYVPPKELSPLYLVASDGSKLPSNSFLIPRWGGIAVVNPNRTMPHFHYSADDLKSVMEIFISQLRSLLGVKELKLFSSRARPLITIEYATSSVGITSWELDRVLRRTTIKNLANAGATLKSIATLIQSMDNMVVLDHIQILVVSSLDHISKAVEEMTDGGDANIAAKHARLAIAAAETAFFDPTMVSLLYFPDEHKYAVYMPLFTPIAVPLIIALIKEIRRLVARVKASKQKKLKKE